MRNILIILSLMLLASCNNQGSKTEKDINDSIKTESGNVKTDITISDNDQAIINAIGECLKWNKKHNDDNDKLIDTLSVKDNMLLSFHKDNSLLITKLNELFSAKKSNILAEENGETQMEITVLSYKKSDFISFSESILYYSFSRSHNISYNTYFNFNNEIYQVKIKSTDRIKKTINDYLKKHKLKCSEDFDISRDFDFYIFKGEIYLVALFNSDLAEESQGDFDGDQDNENNDFTGFIKLKFDNDLRFQLIKIDDVIKKTFLNTQLLSNKPTKYDKTNASHIEVRFFC